MLRKALLAIALWSTASANLGAFEPIVSLGGEFIPVYLRETSSIDLDDTINSWGYWAGRSRINMKDQSALLKTVKVGIESDFYVPYLRTVMDGNFGLFRGEGTPRFWMVGYGIMYRPINTSRFQFSLGPKINWADIDWHVSTISPLFGYGNHIFLTGSSTPSRPANESMATGETVSLSGSGAVYQVVANLQYFITKDLGISIDGTWIHSDFLIHEFRAEDNTLNFDSPLIVKQNWTLEHALLRPRIDIDGFTVAGALVYRFRFFKAFE